MCKQPQTGFCETRSTIDVGNDLALCPLDGINDIPIREDGIVAIDPITHVDMQMCVLRQGAQKFAEPILKLWVIQVSVLCKIQIEVNVVVCRQHQLVALILNRATLSATIQFRIPKGHSQPWN